MTPVKKGFTLIELVMVIVILGILASMALPKFVNLKTNTIEKSEDSTVGSIKTAIQTVHLSYVVMGYEDSWPRDVPLALLQRSPKYIYWTTIGFPDNETWRYFTWGSGYYSFFCPHYNAISPLFVDIPTATKGRYYMYNFTSTEGYNVKPGDISLVANLGH